MKAQSICLPDWASLFRHCEFIGGHPFTKPYIFFQTFCKYDGNQHVWLSSHGIYQKRLLKWLSAYVFTVTPHELLVQLTISDDDFQDLFDAGL